MITATQQEAVQLGVIERIKAGESGNKLATRLGVASATITAIKNGQWAKLSDGMLRKVAAQLNIDLSQRIEWTNVATITFLTIKNVCKECYEYNRMMATCGRTGVGKTVALEALRDENPDKYIYVLCDVTMTSTHFLNAILRGMGRSVPKMSIGEKVREITKQMKARHLLLILDDFGKVSDQIYRLLQLIYDQTKGAAGIAIFGTPRLKKYMDAKSRKQTYGFAEIHRRISYWMELQATDEIDKMQVLKANGFSDLEVMQAVITRTESLGAMCEYAMNALRVSGGFPPTLDTLSKLNNFHATR